MNILSAKKNSPAKREESLFSLQDYDFEKALFQSPAHDNFQ